MFFLRSLPGLLFFLPPLWKFFCLPDWKFFLPWLFGFPREFFCFPSSSSLKFSLLLNLSFLKLLPALKSYRNTFDYSKHHPAMIIITQIDPSSMRMENNHDLLIREHDTHFLLSSLLPPFSRKSRSVRIPLRYFLISSFKSRFSLCLRRVLSTCFCFATFLCSRISRTFCRVFSAACFSRSVRRTYKQIVMGDQC